MLPLIILDKVYISILSIAIVVSAIITSVLAKVFKLIRNLYYYKKSYQTLKRNPNIFSVLLSSNIDRLFPADEFVLKIREGSPNICFILDLSCEQCIGAIKEFYHIKSFAEQVGLSITFKLKDEHEEMFSGFIDKLFVMNGVGEDWLEELRKWYSSKEFRQANSNLSCINFKCKEILEFTKSNNLTQSPILLVNNTVLSNDYSYYDLSDILRTKYS